MSLLLVAMLLATSSFLLLTGNSRINFGRNALKCMLTSGRDKFRRYQSIHERRLLETGDFPHSKVPTIRISQRPPSQLSARAGIHGPMINGHMILKKEQNSEQNRGPPERVFYVFLLPTSIYVL